MAAANDTASMALFCDFENIALGVRDAQYEKFDIRPILERLLAKGSIVVKKAYCDWDRYKTFKAAMHEANFELIEIPHVRQSGKNSADIRMVVDALDLCYTKAHVDTFVIISGDSDFSPLVSKLRENAKQVIGVGVKQSCSDLLVTNCDEFIYYDDLVREREGARAGQRREREKRTPEEEARRREKQEERKNKAVDIVTTTFVDLIADRGESERIWASVLKEVVKRRNPGFNESYFGFRSFGNLLEEAAQRGLLGFGRDDKGAYVFRAAPRPSAVEGENGGEGQIPAEEAVLDLPAASAGSALSGLMPALGESVSENVPAAEAENAGNGRRRGSRRGRGRERAVDSGEPAPAQPGNETGWQAESPEPGVAPEGEREETGSGLAASPETAVPGEGEVGGKSRRGGRRPRRTSADAAAISAEMPVLPRDEPGQAEGPGQPVTAAGGAEMGEAAGTEPDTVSGSENEPEGRAIPGTGKGRRKAAAPEKRRSRRPGGAAAEDMAVPEGAAAAAAASAELVPGSATAVEPAAASEMPETLASTVETGSAPAKATRGQRPATRTPRARKSKSGEGEA